MEDKTRDHMARAITGKKEDAIREALDALLGAWTIDEVRRRCRMVSIVGSPIDTLYIDDQPALEIHPVEFETIRHEDRLSIRVTQNVRHLWRNGEKND